MTIHSQNIKDEAMVYVMNDGFDYGMPSQYYLNIIRQGYKDCHLDMKYLDNAVEEISEIVEEMEIKEKYPLGYKDIRP